MMFWYGGHWAIWQMGLMAFAMIVFWALVIGLVYYFVTAAIRSSRLEHGHSAVTILNQRLARGEIDAEEHQRLRNLMADGEHRKVSSGDRR
jgi:putative membrane protein